MIFSAIPWNLRISSLHSSHELFVKITINGNGPFSCLSITFGLVVVLYMIRLCGDYSQKVVSRRNIWIGNKHVTCYI